MINNSSITRMDITLPPSRLPAMACQDGVPLFWYVNEFVCQYQHCPERSVPQSIEDNHPMGYTLCIGCGKLIEVVLVREYVVAEDSPLVQLALLAKTLGLGGEHG